MSATTRLLVLGVVRIFQPVHGYDVRRELMSWHVDEWASIAPGSIYNALKSLTRDGVLEVVGVKQVGGRPERTTYRLTARGEQELGELLRATWWTVRMPLDPLAAGVALIAFMKRDEAIAALEARIAHVQGQLEHGEHAIAAIDDVETPAHVRELLRLLYARLGSEITWARALIPRLRAGEYSLGGEPGWSPRQQPAGRRRNGRPPRGRGGPRNLEPGHNARPDRPGRVGPPDRPGRSGLPGKPGRVVRLDRPDRPGANGSPDKPGRDGPPSRAARDGSPDKPGREGQPGRVGRDGSPDKPGRDGPPGRAARDGSPDKPGREGPPSRAARDDRSAPGPGGSRRRRARAQR